MFGIVSISKNFVPVFFGAGYDKVTSIIYILSPMVLLMGLANVLGTQYLLPLKKQKEYTFSVTIGVIVNFILNYILITLYQSIGAAIATVLSQIVVDALQYNHVKKEITLKELLNLCSKYVISAVVMFALCFCVRCILNTNPITQTIFNLATNMQLNKEYLFNIVSIIFQVGVGAITYIVMLIVLKDEYIYKFIDKMKSRFLKKKTV